MNQTMRGLVKPNNGPGDLVYRTDLPIPSIAPDEVLIKVHCTALCGTDVHIIDWDEWSKKHIQAPVTLGHETAGDIVAVGSKVTDRKVGDRVSCESHIFCGDCYFCQHDMRHICSNMQIFGVSNNGAFAEYAAIRADCTFVIPDDMDYATASLFEPMGAGVHGAEVAEPQDKVVLVSGCGPIGLTAISASKVMGARLVIACDLIDERLEVAKNMGADIIINSGREDVTTKVLALTDGLGADTAIDITGAEAAINTALKSLRTAGRLVCVGLPTAPVTLQDMANDLIYREIELTGISGRTIWGTWETFSKVLQSPYYDTKQVIGGHFDLADYQEAIEQMRQGVPGKMLLYPQGLNTNE